MITVVLAGGGTGGHLFPAIAIADAIRSAHPEWRIAFAGSERGVEAAILPSRGLEHRLFPMQPLHRRQWWRNAGWPALAWRLWRDVGGWLRDLQPSLVIGTGGYVAAPVVWSAAGHGIATAILELDVKPGLGTRLVARRVDEIWLGASEALARIPPSARDRVVVTGAPIHPPEHERSAPARQAFALDPDVPTIVITGGSQGSLAVNHALSTWLATGHGAGRQVIWATGRNLYQQFAHHHAPPAVRVVPFLDPIADAWAVADLAIARAGMMTIAELAAWGIPAILVPLPTAAADHQAHNARAAAATGAAVMLPQAELSVARLEAEVAGLLDDPTRCAEMRERALERGRAHAAAEIAERAGRLVAKAK